MRDQFTIIFLIVALYIVHSTFYMNSVHAQAASCPTSGSSPRAQGLISTTNITGSNFGTSANKCVIDPNAAFAPYKKSLTYDDLKANYYAQSKAKATANPDSSTTTITNTNISNNTVQNFTNLGPLSIGSLDYSGKTAVLFIEHDLSITGNITGSANDGLVLVVGGNININTFPTTVTQIDAILISSGTIYTGGSGCSTNSVQTSALTVNGSLISLNSSQPIHFCRSLLNNSNPAEVINQQPKYLILLRSLFAQPLQIWSELQ